MPRGAGILVQRHNNIGHIVEINYHYVVFLPTMLTELTVLTYLSHKFMNGLKYSGDH